MSSQNGMVPIFASCSRLLSSVAQNLGDKFFFDLCEKESDKLLSEFIRFLKFSEGDRADVAQCASTLILQIKNIINLLSIFNHLGITKPPTSLALERDLLRLWLSVLDSGGAGLINQRVPMRVGSKEIKKVKPRHKFVLSPKHKEILELIKNNEMVQNLEIFGKFADISKRTIKRKLSELIKSNNIKRKTDGKKVFYVAVN